MNAILQDPAVSDRLKTMSFVPYGGGTLQQTQDYIEAQHKAWATLVREMHNDIAEQLLQRLAAVGRQQAR